MKPYIVTTVLLVFALLYLYTSQNTDKIGTSLDIAKNNKFEEIDRTIDIFGIKKLYPDLVEGRVWASNWSNGESRTLKSGQRDPHDSDFIARGNGNIKITGNGIVTLTGQSPRIYVYDKNRILKWHNVEVTIYGKRLSELKNISSQGFVIGARSEHQNADEKNPCLGRTYYGRILYDGRAVFQKEVIHEGAYSVNKPSENNKAIWNTPNGVLPKNIWIGIKFVVKNSIDNKSVILELYRDLTDGKDGGTWEKVAEYTDSGSWSQTDTGIDVKSICGYGSGKILLEPATSVFIRNDEIVEAQYKNFSIREID